MNALSTFASLRPQGMTAAAVGGVGSSRPPHISIDQNRFSLVDSGGNVKPLPPKILTDPAGQQIAVVALDVVFVMTNPHPSKIYWGGKEYNPNSIDPPTCFSDNGVAPSAQAQVAQNPTCNGCRHNAIGSAVSKFSGAKIKACQDFKKLAAVCPELGVDGIEFLMQIKPGSFKNWSSVLNWIKGQRLADGTAAELYDFVIRMTFESQGVLKFEPVAWVAGNQQLEALIVGAWGKMAALDDMVGKNDQPFAGAIAGGAATPVTQQAVTQALPPPPPAPMVAAQQYAPAPVQQFAQPDPFAGRPPVPFGSPTAPIAAPAAPSLMAMPAQTAAPNPPAEPPKRRRRTKEEIAQDEAAKAAQQARGDQLAAQALNSGALPGYVSGLSSVPPTGAPVAQQVLPSQADDEIPPFLRRPAPQTVQPVNTPPANTGLAVPQPMPEGLAAQLTKAFEFPT